MSAVSSPLHLQQRGPATGPNAKMFESEKELVAKMLRAVLQSNKHGVALHRLQSEYKALTGEWIPFKEMGFYALDTYLKSIPTVVRMDIGRVGEIICHAVVCKETAQIAELVARQRTSKKKSGGQINCQMRLKYSAPITHIGKPKAMLRKPDFAPKEDRVAKKPIPLAVRGKSNVWSGRLFPDPLSVHVAPTYGSVPIREVQVQRNPTIASRPEKKVSLPPRFQKEVHQFTVQHPVTDSNANEIPSGKAPLLGSMQPNLPLIQGNLRDLFNKHTHGILLAKLPSVYKETFKQDLDAEVLKQVVNWSHLCTAQKFTHNGSTEVLLCSPTKKPQMPQKITQQNTDQVKPIPTYGQTKPPSSPKQTTNSVPHSELKQKVSELLSHYSNGLWLQSLPKVFEDTYKITFPSDALKMNDLSEISSVDVISENPYKAILYPKSPQSGAANQNLVVMNEGQMCVATPAQMEQKREEEMYLDLAIPPLVIPTEVSPSVLVLELTNTEDVVIRYVGKNYSGAQELMEEEMKEYYNRNASSMKLNSMKVAQLVAVKVEDEIWLRAQILSIEANKIKVFYVDHGFNEVVDCSKVCRLDKPFFSLPFQAAKCRLAGLEAFCADPVVLKAVETKAYGKILAVEILQKSDKPLVVLYDTSGDEDININAVCLQELYDHSLLVQVQVNASYTNVNVTNVCSDGTLFCQLPSKGLTKLNDMLHKIEAEFNSKTVTSSLFVSLPFSGKVCLLFNKGKWARVEITSVHSSRALDVQFLDTGSIASVKVSELREIPSHFLRDLISIPPQAKRCCLADLPLNIGMWTPDAVLWLRSTVLNRSECSIKVVNIDEAKSMLYIHLFTSRASLDSERSINRQIISEEVWKLQKSLLPSTADTLSKAQGDAVTQVAVTRKDQSGVTKKQAVEQGTSNPSIDLPPPLPLPRSGAHIDVFVSVACHPGHFVFQPWQELHKLEVLMEEMLLHYSTTEEKQPNLEKNKLYAAKVDKKWYRVLLRGILTNGLVSVYELDYGRHELVNSRQILPLMDKFRQLPFQAVTSQLAGVKCEQWSEEAANVFRNHVEKKPLVALIQEIHESTNSWDRKVVAYIVDTTLPDTDIWIHDLMSEYLAEISKSD